MKTLIDFVNEKKIDKIIVKFNGGNSNVWTKEFTESELFAYVRENLNKYIPILSFRMDYKDGVKIWTSYEWGMNFDMEIIN